MKYIKYYHVICVTLLIIHQHCHALFQLNINFFNIAIHLFDDDYNKLKLTFGVNFEGKEIFNIPCTVGIAYENRSDSLLNNIFASLSLRHYASRMYSPATKNSNNTDENILFVKQALNITRTLSIKSSLSGDNICISYIPNAQSWHRYPSPTYFQEEQSSVQSSSQENTNDIPLENVTTKEPLVGVQKTIFDHPSLYIPYFFNYYANLGFSITKKNNEWDIYFHNADNAALKFKGSIFNTEFINVDIRDKNLENYFTKNPHKFSALLLSFMANAAVFGCQEAGREIAQEAERQTNQKSRDASFGALVKYLEKKHCNYIRL